MEITRPAFDTSLGAHAWVDRRRDEFHRTSMPIRVIGVLGWAALLVSALARLG
jgi:hypothetical protein